MVRFKCIHCGERIAVQEHQMGSLTRCPECGGVTHPLAAQLVANKEADAASKSLPDREAKQPAVEVEAAPEIPACGNCGGPIGKLQKPLEWDDHPVCLACHRELSEEKDRAENRPQTAVAVRANYLPPELDVSAYASPDKAIHPMSRGAMELTVAFWRACFGLCATVIALFLVVMVLQSLGALVIWSAAIVAIIAAYFWIRRGVLALRFPRRAKQVRAIVRE